ncbi:hypothetical protein POM88_022993 [Heracleum sosnowskyi]|uniref:Replication protein A 70 kDa DNA-binding subunit B/D first OB fold domain-containing protein n=1 Tax=Heracleum sosnowskyi TaxID=360622 RepID=A0AAD8IIN2_9APIA|nr:hypothetical protein POM88_022993 [Heracleum sosnowskyi]
MDYHTITDLKPMNKFNWKIRVRVTKKWLQRIPRTQYCNGLNLILVDEDHERIHAWIGESILNYFDQIFHEGNTYEIKNFVVKFYETTEIDRCFKDEQHIIMSHLTKARKLYISHTIIPFDVCKFTDISFIPQLQHNINHYIDVVGIVYSVDPMEVSMYDGEDGVSSISFWVSDNLKKVKIIFYGQLAQLLDVSLMQVNDNKRLSKELIMSKREMIHADKKRKINFNISNSTSDSSSDHRMKVDPENIEKSLTNLQINIRALAGTIEDMMTAFETFSEEFKANHNMLVEDMEELKGFAKDISNSFNHNNA